MRCSEFRAVVLRHFIFLYHESSASLTFISHLEGYFSTGVVHTVSNHASLRNMARHNHSLRVSSWEFTLASTTQLVDGLCYRFFFFFFLFLHYIDCRTALLFMSMHFTCSLHSGSCFCMPGIPFVESLKIQAFARNAIRSHIAINTRWADLKATEQAEAVNTHSPSSLHITPPS